MYLGTFSHFEIQTTETLFQLILAWEILFHYLILHFIIFEAWSHYIVQVALEFTK